MGGSEGVDERSSELLDLQLHILTCTANELRTLEQYKYSTYTVHVIMTSNVKQLHGTDSRSVDRATESVTCNDMHMYTYAIYSRPLWVWTLPHTQCHSLCRLTNRVPNAHFFACT